MYAYEPFFLEGFALIQARAGPILAHMGPHGPLWAHMGPARARMRAKSSRKNAPFVFMHVYQKSSVLI